MLTKNNEMIISFIGFPELILILVIALMVFAPGKLPGLGKVLGRAIHRLRRASRELIGEQNTPRGETGTAGQGQGEDGEKTTSEEHVSRP